MQIGGGPMQLKNHNVNIAQLMLIAITRGMLGVGIGLIAAGYLSDTQRTSIGWTLISVGVILTIPILMEVFAKKIP
jgi:hypothetical protein